MVNDNREQILAVLKSKGPSVPNDVKKVLKGDTLIFGAMLSELSSRGLVKITDLKKGSSPFYYLPGQEAKLDALIEFLNPKDQTTVRYLKENKVVQDKTLNLLQRVSLRKIKDFAKEMKVSTSAGELLFWRYHTISETEAMQFLKDRYNKPSTSPVQEKKKEPILETKIEEEKEIKQSVAKKIGPETSDEEIIKAKELVKKREEEKRKKLEEEKKQLAQKQKNKTNYSQKQITTSPSLDATLFYDLIWKYFKEQGIEVLEESMISKNREYEFVVVVPSVIGTINYYCRARSKKKLNEGDVAPALLKAKQKDLQCLFLTNGDFTKKSLVLINKEYSGIIIKNF